jgi:PEP-CTERM motif
VLVAGSNVNAVIAQQTGRSVVVLNTVFNGNDGATGSLVTGGGYTAPFGLDINLFAVAGLNKTTINGISTTTFARAKVAAGDVLGTVGSSPVPEPSTLSLLGLGAAGLVFGVYRRRMAAAAV